MSSTVQPLSSRSVSAAPDDGSEVHPALRPAVEVPEEVTLQVSGALPPELRGTLYRNGPGRWEAGGFVAQHAFDGDGLVSKFVIDQGQVRFRSRYVRTPKYLTEQAGHGSRVRGLGTQRAGGPLFNAGRMPADSANTHAVVHADRLLALSDVGRPWEIDQDSLDTRGECTFDGRLPRLSRFSPHPRLDPVTGELFKFGLDLAPRPAARAPIGLRCYRVDPRGRLHVDGVIPTGHAYIQHDFAITEHYYVFVLAPITLDPVKAMSGFGTTEQATSWRPEIGTRIVLVPRGGGPRREIECPPLVYVHVNNAYEDGQDVVIELVRYDDYREFFEPVRNFRGAAALSDFGGYACQVRVTHRDRVIIEDLTDQRTELPQHDWRRTGRTYRYGYHTVLTGDSTSPGAIVKHDNHTGAHIGHPFQPGDAVGEPIFVPRAADAAEDEGWLLCVVYLAAEHRSALVVLDAQRIEAAPLAIARLDRHFFPGFHGSFTDRVSPEPRTP